jgi:hypothetical protein
MSSKSKRRLSAAGEIGRRVLFSSALDSVVVSLVWEFADAKAPPTPPAFAELGYFGSAIAELVGGGEARLRGASRSIGRLLPGLP